MNIKTIQHEFLLYIGVGGIAFLVDFSLLTLLTSGVGLNYLVATLFAFLFGTLANYILSVHWVFRYRAFTKKYNEFSLFLLVGFITLVLSLGLMAFLVENLGLNYLIAKCLVTSVTLIFNFAGRKILLFTHWKDNVKDKQLDRQSARRDACNSLEAQITSHQVI